MHIELASHALIRAGRRRGRDLRRRQQPSFFENAEEYALLYPDEERTPAQFCTERLADCYEVEMMIRWCLADRAAELLPMPDAKAA